MRFAMVVGMSQNVDPSGNTEAFRAFQERQEAAAPAATSRTPLIVGLVIAAIVLVALVVWLVV
jgi:hypothetical protein